MKIERPIYLDEIKSRMRNGMIKIITGPRRCGKSYFLFEIFCDYLMAQGIDEEHLIKVDLENRRNIELRNPDNLINYIDSRIVDREMHYILIDEIQQVDDFVDVLNSYLKMKNVDVYVTGSNSRLLSKDVVTEFRGRGSEISMYPLSFAEFFSVNSGDRYSAMEEYMTYGGMPIVAMMSSDKEKAIYLKSLFETVYFRDILERYNIKNEIEFAELVNIMASNIGALTNLTKLENTFKSLKNVTLSKKTIKVYLDCLEDVFLIKKSDRYDIKGKKYFESSYKYYFLDIGIRNALLNFRQVERTHIMENIIYNELIMRGMSVDVGVVNTVERNKIGRQQRKQLEIDFVCNLASKRIYVQSAFVLDTEEKMRQEMHSFKKLDDHFMKIIISFDALGKHLDDNGILHINIFDFLLDRDSLVF